MEETAYAKLNLALHVRGREPDGYHRIETAFAFAEDGDRLTVAEGEGISLEVTGPFAGSLAGDDNIVLEAAHALRGRGQVAAGAALTLDKRLPVASGIGGGSADAAAALRLLSRWWRLELPDGALAGIASGLGSDVPACLHSRSARGEGRGDRLDFADWGLGGAPMLLVNPGVKLSTRSVFERWNGRDGGALGDPATGRNDLEAPALGLVPEIGRVLEALASSNSARMVRMSGSGATCFGLFENSEDRDEAGRRIAARHPRWWTLASRLR
ncbi:MAG TPA: 4-(cytidine 5'-diphospho)-2-C-methyl-D-erythritol kinase [Allosphingosinicella sp.]|nr:4-(cytidine 5'-diphospho)-2-C-methyl-D-erythritol kinase [Allosphingosinicella sp.]